MKNPTVARRPRMLRRRFGEGAATAVIGTGIAMLVQPFSLALFTWSFPVILVGAAAFVVTSHFPD
ncbi:hypothetical protein AB4Z48_35350 [Cupriavidus sp. 2TAF22]|uniref:hypothetical protein n=1 Tax=unclassified Cupriavidus TaxID=2640874 RepID=UPI003F92577F